MELFFMMTAMLALLVPIIAGRVRRALITPRLLDQFKRMLPTMFETEPVAHEASTTWWDAHLLSCKPDRPRLLAYRRPSLSAGRRALPWQISRASPMR